MKQQTIQEIGADIGCLIRNDARYQQGRFIAIRFYPATDYKPFRAYAVWKGFEGETVRRRITGDFSVWDTSREAVAMQAASHYLEWLQLRDNTPAGFVPVLTGLAFAYDGASGNDHAVIVSWGDARGMRSHEYDHKAAAIREFVSGLIRLDNDINGNPRYYIGKYSIPEDRREHARHFVTTYRGKKYGAGYVLSSYNVESSAENILFG